MKKFFKLFFGKYFGYGIILVLSSCIIYMQWSDIFYLQLCSNILSTVGIALLLGSIFDFSRNSEEYTDFISGIIKGTIVSKDFLDSLTEAEKKKILEAVVIPNESEANTYSSISSYYKRSIDSFINISNRPFKTNISINVIAKLEEGKVVCYGNMSYRRYKTGDKYDSIPTYFDKKDSSILDSYILLPNGEKVALPDSEEKLSDRAEKSKASARKKYVTNVPDTLNDNPYITLYKSFKEIGYDHWITFSWASFTPCDGINFNLHCLDGLIIKGHQVFDDTRLYEININDNKDKINIISTSWLNEYTGFTLTIAKDNESDDSNESKEPDNSGNLEEPSDSDSN